MYKSYENYIQIELAMYVYSYLYSVTDSSKSFLFIAF